MTGTTWFGAEVLVSVQGGTGLGEKAERKRDREPGQDMEGAAHGPVG